MVRTWPYAHGRCALLAFDHHYTDDGEVDLEHSEFYVPNDYVWDLWQKYPDCFLPTCSVHPYRKDARKELKVTLPTFN